METLFLSSTHRAKTGMGFLGGLISGQTDERSSSGQSIVTRWVSSGCPAAGGSMSMPLVPMASKGRASVVSFGRR